MSNDTSSDVEEDVEVIGPIKTRPPPHLHIPLTAANLRNNNNHLEAEAEEEEGNEEERSFWQKIRGFLPLKKTKAKNVVRLFSPRKSILPLPGMGGRDDEVSDIEDSGGVIFGLKKKHFIAQLNLTILTFTVTALISLAVLTFAAVMLAVENLDDVERIAYLGIITTILAGWLPSPTTLVKTTKK